MINRQEPPPLKRSIKKVKPASLMLIMVLAGLLILPRQGNAQETGTQLPENVQESESAALQKNASKGPAPVLRFNSPREATLVLSMDRALELARENNLVLKNAELELESAKAGRKTVVDMDPAELGYTYGQINTGANDRFLELEQNFGSILTHIQRSGLVKQEIEVKKSNLLLSQAELERRVKLIYQYWIYHYSLMNLTEREYEYYSKLTRIAQAQYESGEIDLLKKSLVETSFTGLQNELLENQRLYAETVSLLQQVLQVSMPLEPSDSVQSRLSPGIGMNTEEQPLIIQYYDDLYKLELANVRLEKSRYFPGLSAMYFDQTIDRNTGFSGFRVGLTFPLWFVPQGGRVEQARLQSEIARNEMRVQAIKRDRNIDIIRAKIRSYTEQLDYYEDAALKSAETLIQTADLQLQKQGIEYFEYIGSVSVGLDIRREYQKLLNDYNLAVIELEYLLK